MAPVEDKTEFDLAATAPVGAVVAGTSPGPDEPSAAMPEPDPPEPRRDYL
jgi:hypothetical protein